jgi:hypothetical protein
MILVMTSVRDKRVEVAYRDQKCALSLLLKIKYTIMLKRVMVTTANNAETRIAEIDP